MSRYIDKLADRLFEDDAEREAFAAALASKASGVDAIAWLGTREELGFERKPAAAWQPEWVDALAPGQAPARRPEFHAGRYYCLDLSSVFCTVPLREVGVRRLGEVGVRRLADLCVAPGGKLVLAARQLGPEVMLANEIVGKRIPALLSNLKRCGLVGAIISRSDVRHLGAVAEGAFDGVLLDAPCSGQSLVARGEGEPGAFHPATVSMNERRQRRIIAEGAKLVRRGGFLAYSTCTFSPEENEDVIEWFVDRFPEFRTVPIEALAPYRTRISEIHLYRLFPQAGFGSGAAVCLLRREGDEPAATFDREALGWTLEVRAEGEAPELPIDESEDRARTKKRR